LTAAITELPAEEGDHLGVEFPVESNAIEARRVGA